jgi:hypothetical protein
VNREEYPTVLVVELEEAVGVRCHVDLQNIFQATAHDKLLPLTL